MELKINIDTKTIAGNIVQDMLLNLHGNIMAYTQRRFSPQPAYNAVSNRFGMGTAVHTSEPENTSGRAAECLVEGKNHPMVSGIVLATPYGQSNAWYYDTQKFQAYRELLQSIAYNQLLMETIEKAIATHVEIFLNLGEAETTTKDSSSGV